MDKYYADIKTMLSLVLVVWDILVYINLNFCFVS